MQLDAETTLSPIRKLSENVVGQIAAGEVLERPAHLVKELIENSLDAKATEIDLDVSFGGKYVKLTDNGVGISAEDLPLALERFCTSKIEVTDDLWKLHSFGFRGEALASTAAVSRLTITSQRKNSKKAYQLRSDYGKVEQILESSHTLGTTVTVEGLFENVPARLKFLRSDSAELNQIKRVFKAFALTWPQVSFRFRQNGQLLLYYQAVPSTDSEAWKTRVEHVLDKNLSVTEKKSGDIQVRIAFGSASEVEKTTQNIWVFVQSRWVQDKSIQAAVIEAYRTLLMHGEYPVAVVQIQMNPQDLDVNIHPTKTQVKFLKPSEIFRAVHGTLRSFFEKSGTGPLKFEEDVIEETQSVLPAQVELSPENYDTVQFKTKSLDSQNREVFSVPSVVSENISAYVSERTAAVATTSKKNLFGSFWGQLQILGQANLTYILAQSRQSLFLIDQHAAHERIAFETLMAGWRASQFEIQAYLIPLTVELDAEDVDALLKEQDFFAKLGIEMDQLSPTVVSIRSAPSLLNESSLTKAILKWVTEHKKSGGSFAVEKTVSDLFATMACHSVIRAGQALSHEEMKGLLEQMDQFAFSGYCPHGRPVYLEYPFSDLDRSFGRIV
ncbi:MAG: DNA mismatch repair endonuclease MutL [Bdellovibrionales bacterium]